MNVELQLGVEVIEFGKKFELKKCLEILNTFYCRSDNQFGGDFDGASSPLYPQ